MRVTDRMMYDNAATGVGQARARLEDATGVASSGARVVHPGDDPAAAGLLAVERARAARFDAVQTTAGRASDELGAADSALSEVGNDVARATELAVQLSNGTYSASDRAAAAKEVRGLLASSVASLNAKVGNRYVLGGFKDGAPPFDAAGSYAGDANVRQVEIAPGVLQDSSVRADVAVKGAGGGVDVLATLGQLATALEANDAAGVQGTIAALTQGTAQISTARGSAGAAIATLDAAVTAGQTARDAAKASAGKLGDADAVQAATELQLARTALQTSLAAVSQGFQLSLVNYLK